MFEIPSQFQKTHYNAHILPKEGKPLDLSVGANCQVYAYAVLTHFGKHPPLLRSSQLWTDQCQTIPVTILQPLDLMLYNKTAAAYGAHVGVHIGNDQVLYLSLDLGLPTIQTHQRLLSQKKYAHFIGAKRVLL